MTSKMRVIYNEFSAAELLGKIRKLGTYTKLVLSSLIQTLRIRTNQVTATISIAIPIQS